jgi:hypothetical protein
MTKLGEARFKTMTLAFSAGVNRRVGFLQREAATTGEICQPVAGSIAGISMKFSMLLLGLLPLDAAGAPCR